MKYLYPKVPSYFLLRFFLLLTLFCLFFFIPHAKAEAFCDSGNNILYCGVTSKGSLLNQMQNGDGVHSGANIRTILGYYGITETEVSNDSITVGYVDKSGRVYSGSKTYATGQSWGAGRLPDVSGTSKKFHTIYITLNQYSFVYGSVAQVLIGTHNGAYRFAIMTGCGNIASKNPPTVLQSPTYTISGQVFNDLNHNGRIDRGEGGVSGITVTGGGKSARTNGSGNYTLSNVPSGTQTVSISVPSGWKATTTTAIRVTGGPNKTNINFGITRLYTISGEIYTDANHDGKLDNGEGGASGIPVKGAGKTITSNGNGIYTFTNLLSGNYSVSITVPGGWQATTATTQNVWVGPNKTGINFGITRLYTITGLVFNDINKNYTQDAGEPVYTGPLSITATKGSISMSNGTYIIRNLLSGTLTVYYNSLPSDYVMSYPRNGSPPSFVVTVGTGICTTDTTTGAMCNNGNINNLNFAITNSFPWVQSNCADIRMDNGFDDHLPPGTSAIKTDTTCANPGIVYSGDTDPYFGSGNASSTKEIAGGFSYPEVFSANNNIATSYTELLAKAQNAAITPVNLSTICNLTNCTLPNNLAHGLYQANRDVNLNTTNFAPNSNYIFIINGNLTIRGNITVPVGSTALFSTEKNISIDANVGSAPNSTASNLDGWYIAGQSFIVNTAGNCTDLRLNIAGNIVANANRNGGIFQNNRDLCGFDQTYPTVSVSQRLDMILNAPNFLRQQVTISQEVAP